MLKLSGIYATLSAMYESLSRPVDAYTTLRTALQHFGPTALMEDYHQSISWAGSVSSKDHLRAIGLSQKLGQMALSILQTRIPPPYPPYDGVMTPAEGVPRPVDWDTAAGISSFLRSERHAASRSCDP